MEEDFMEDWTSMKTKMDTKIEDFEEKTKYKRYEREEKMEAMWLTGLFSVKGWHSNNLNGSYLGFVAFFCLQIFIKTVQTEKETKCIVITKWAETDGGRQFVIKQQYVSTSQTDQILLKASPQLVSERRPSETEITHTCDKGIMEWELTGEESNGPRRELN